MMIISLTVMSCRRYADHCDIPTFPAASDSLWNCWISSGSSCASSAIALSHSSFACWAISPSNRDSKNWLSSRRGGYTQTQRNANTYIKMLVLVIWAEPDWDRTVYGHFICPRTNLQWKRIKLTVTFCPVLASALKASAGARGTFVFSKSSSAPERERDREITRASFPLCLIKLNINILTIATFINKLMAGRLDTYIP